MSRRPPRTTLTDTLYPHTTLCRSDLPARAVGPHHRDQPQLRLPYHRRRPAPDASRRLGPDRQRLVGAWTYGVTFQVRLHRRQARHRRTDEDRSEEQTSELQSLMRNSYAVFCLTKKTKHI